MFSIFKKKKVIVTHNGSFHADDIFAVAVLSLVLEKEYEIEIIRTRDKEKIDSADFVVDVGNVHDPDKNRFDHHQQGGAGVRANGIPYASFGLVWKKYGETLCGSQKVADKIDQKMICPIDAHDNGVEVTRFVSPDIQEYTMNDMAKAFRTTWKEDQKDMHERFMYLVKFAQELISREIKKAKDKGEVGSIIADLYKKTEDKRLLVLDRFYPFDTAENGMDELLFVIYPDFLEGHWCIKAIADQEQSFESRMPFPETWAGKTGKLLEEATGIKGSIFCHKGRFLAVAKTKEAAVMLAQKALEG